MIESGLSKWTYELKEADNENLTDHIESKCVMCECGYERKIGGDGAGVASFFYVKHEWICLGCGRVLGD